MHHIFFPKWYIYRMYISVHGSVSCTSWKCVTSTPGAWKLPCLFAQRDKIPVLGENMPPWYSNLVLKSSVRLGKYISRAARFKWSFWLQMMQENERQSLAISEGGLTAGEISREFWVQYIMMWLLMVSVFHSKIVIIFVALFGCRYNNHHLMSVFMSLNCTQCNFNIFARGNGYLGMINYRKALILALFQILF